MHNLQDHGETVMEPYRNVIVGKPWGSEYLCYRNGNLAIWLLSIRCGGRTSLHCHPNKNTGFVVLDGQVEVSFLKDSIHLRGLDKIDISRGTFHSTRAITDSGAHIFEIETPENKHDLVRLEDDYGRRGLGYEGRDHETPKTDDCLWIGEPDHEAFCCEVKGGGLRHFRAEAPRDLSGFSDQDFFVISRGGLMAQPRAQILRPGDVIDGVSLERLARRFSLVPGTTMLHIFNHSREDASPRTKAGGVWPDFCAL